MNKNVKLDRQEKRATALVHSLSHDGRGIATINHKTTFIRGALPGETVDYQITQKHRHYDEAHLLSIIQTSPKRVLPPCSHFGVCGGCSLQHMDIETQVNLKQHTLLDQLKIFGQVTPASILPPLSLNTAGYRRKARLGAKFVIKKNKVFVGFREKSSRFLTDIQHCLVLHPKIGEHLTELNQLITSLQIYQHIPQIEVAIGDEEAALVFRHLEALSEEDQEKLISFGKEKQFHIYTEPNPPLPILKLWPNDSKERLSYSLPDYQLEFLFHPLDFVQINLEVNRLMVQQAIRLLDLKSHETVLDLYCGIGNFTLSMARFTKKVTGIEGNKNMVLRAEENAKHNQILNVDFYTANLESPAKDASWLKTKYDKILLDPARTGAKNILPFFTSLHAKKIMYVSCNPATLARDAGELVHHHGYQLTQVGIMNMFPHTAHIEAMAIFDKPL